MTIFTVGTLIKANGNGAITVFDTDFKIIDETHLKVYEVVDDVPVLRNLGSEYTVTNVGVPTGCTVTFVTPPAPGVDNVIIERQVPLAQSADYIENDEFPAAIHETVLDIAYMAIQEIDTRVRRAISPSITAPVGFSGTLPTPAPLFLLAWAADGLSLTNLNPADLDVVISSGSILTQTFSGDGATTVFNLIDTPVSTQNLEVFVGGSRKIPIQDYSLNGVVLTFEIPPTNGVNNIFVRWATSIERAVANIDSSAVIYDGVGSQPSVKLQLDELATKTTSLQTGGTATAYTLTPSPAITANADKLRFRANFHTAAGATPTLSVSGQTALPLKYKDAAGALQAITSEQVPSGWRADVECDGTNWVVQQTAGDNVIAASLTASAVGHGAIINGQLTASVAANALTVALKTQAGTDPSSSDPVLVAVRSATLGDGGWSLRQVTSALSLTVSSGSTLGTSNNIASKIAVLLIDNAGALELAVVNTAGSVDISETGLASTTAEGGAGGADSASTIYSTTARSNVAYRALGYVESTQATAGTWATAPSTVQTVGGQARVGRATRIDKYTGSGSWVCPPGVTVAWVTGVGGGGGGGNGDSGTSTSGGGGSSGVGTICQQVSVNPGSSYTVTIGGGGGAASAGGTTSFGALVSLSGGNPGVSGSASGNGSGGASAGAYSTPGDHGTANQYPGNGGSGLFGGAGRAAANLPASAAIAAPSNSGGGGGGGRGAAPYTAGSSGGSGFLIIEY